MYQRLKRSLLNPKGLIEYVNDKFIVVALYVLIFGLLYAIPYIASLKNIGDSLYRTYRDAVQVDVMNYKVENHELISTDGLNTIYEYDLGINNPLLSASVVVGIELNEEFINSHKNKMYVLYGKDGVYFNDGISANTLLLNYQNDGDFSKIASGDVDALNAFYGVISDYVSDHMNIIYGFGIPILLVYSFSQIMIIALIISLLCLVIYRRFHVGFGNILKLAIYSMLPLVVCLMFTILLRFSPLGNVLYYVGFIASFVFASVAVNTYVKSKIINNDQGEDNNESI